MAAHGLMGQLAARVYEIIKLIATEQRGYWICTLFFLQPLLAKDFPPVGLKSGKMNPACRLPDGGSSEGAVV